jgi:hypothetical protein
MKNRNINIFIITGLALFSLFLSSLHFVKAEPTLTPAPTPQTPATQNPANTSTPANQPNPTQNSSTTPNPTGTNTNSPGGSAGSESGLVKCGVSRDCTICDIFILIRDIFNFALGLLAALAVVSIVIGGVYVLTSAGNPGRVSEGYGIITNAVIGILLVISSFLLFSFLLVALGFQQTNFSAVFDFQEGQIFSVKCDTASTFNDRGTNGGGVAVPSGPIDIGSLNVACLADTTITGELSAVLRAISVYETPSRGGADGYTLPGNSSSASGRYQVTDPTWSDWKAAAGVSAPSTAGASPPAIQDRVVASYLRRQGITSCDSFVSSARANIGRFSGACRWTPVPICASVNDGYYGQPNDTTRAYPDFAQLCKTLDADNCP